MIYKNVIKFADGKLYSDEIILPKERSGFYPQLVGGDLQTQIWKVIPFRSIFA